MSNLEGERHDGDGKVDSPSAARHIQARGNADKLNAVALLKMDSVVGTTRTTYTIWVDSAGKLRILASEPTAAQLTGTTTAIGTIVGTQS